MIVVKEPFDLRVTLETMKSAMRTGINMRIWARDVKAVEEAIAVIEAIRKIGEAPVIASEPYDWRRDPTKNGGNGY